MALSAKRVSLIFLGCPKNFIDSEAILANLLKGGWELVKEVEKAEIAILTTCAFIKRARKEAKEKIRELISLKKKGKIKKIIVFGCLVQAMPEELPKRFPGVDYFIGLDYIPDISNILSQGFSERIIYKKQPTYLSFERWVQTPSYAYLKISEGCSNFCAYCRIPYLRGTYRSRPIEEILKEAKEIGRMGIKEIILVSQDSTLYGTDLYSTPSLHHLLKRLAEIKEIEWLRLLYTHPAHIYPELLDVIKSEPKVLKYIDLPLQHISNKILLAMKRGYLRKDAERIIDQLREIPEMVIRTTFIVGFPGESEKDFSLLLDFIQEKRFDHIGCFTYSREKGTAAYSLPQQIPYRIKKKREKILMLCQREISRQKLKALIGKEIPVLIDCKKRDFYIGRTFRSCPEIDGYVLIKDKELKIGNIYPMRIFAASAYDLYASRSS